MRDGKCVCPDGMEVDLEREQYCRGVRRFPVNNDYRPGYGSSTYGTYDPNPIDFAALKTFVRDNHVASVDGLLGAFDRNERFRPLLSSFTAMKYSQSTQFPKRIIAHWGNLFIGMNVHADGPAGKLVEVIEFDRAAADFRFRLVDFSVTPATIHEQQNDPRILTCRGCHGVSPRPIWDSYNYWPDAYNAFEPIPFTLGRLARMRPANQSLLIEDLEIHLAIFNHQRMLRELQSDRARFERIKYAVLGAFLYCDDMPSFFPEAARRAMEARLGMTQAQLVEDSRERVIAEYRRRYTREAESIRQDPEPLSEKAKRERPAAGGTFEDYIARQAMGLELHPSQYGLVAKLRYVVEGSGIGMGNWAFAGGPRGQSYTFRTAGSAGLEDLQYYLVPHVTRTDADLLDFNFNAASYTMDSYTRALCGELKRKSLAH